MKNLVSVTPLSHKSAIKKMLRLITSGILCALILHLLASRTFADTANLKWDTNDDASYYVVFYGTESGRYTEESDPIYAPTTQFISPDLADGTWYFSVKAFNEYGNSSDYSDEASFESSSSSTTDPLVAVIASPALSVTVTPGESIVFTGSINGGTAPYTSTWSFGNSGIANSTDQSPGDITFDTEGVFSVIFSVHDSNGNTSNASITVTVESAYADTTPGVSISSPTSAVTITEGGSVNFQGTVSGGNAPLSHTWTFGTDGPNPVRVEDPGDVTFPTAGTYTVTYSVSDNEGDSDSDTVTVTVEELYVDVTPTATITSPTSNVTITEGESVNFQASVSSGNAPFTHSWSFGTGGPDSVSIEDPGDITFPTAGTYAVTYAVSDYEGDTSSATVTVTVEEQYVDVNPTASITPESTVSITAGESVNFQATVSSGNAPFTHLWTFGTDGPNSVRVEDPGDVTFATAGSYTVTYTVTDNDGDTSSDSVLITVKELYVDVNPTASITRPSTAMTITEGESVNFQATVLSGNAPFTHLWRFGTDSSDFSTAEDPGDVTFSAAGTYTVTYTVTDTDGDTSSDTVDITVEELYVDENPTATISPASAVTITEGESVNFKASVSGGNAPFTHDWDFGTGGPGSMSVEDPGDVTFPSSGSYTVTYTVTDHDGDTSSDSVVITVEKLYVDVNPTAEITPSSAVTLNEGESVNFKATVLSGNAPFTHAWDFGTSGVASQSVEDPGDVTFTTAGTYTVTYTVTDNDGDISSDSVVITVNEQYVDVNPTASITPSSAVTITEGDSLNFQATVINGNAPFTHAWNFGVLGPDSLSVEDPGDVTFATAGTYTVTYTVTDNDGDTGSDSVVVTVEVPYVDLKPTATISSPTDTVSVTEGGYVPFTGHVTGGNAPLTYFWDFGTRSKSSSSVKDPGNIEFGTAGIYTVTFTVTDADGDTSSDTRTVTVNTESQVAEETPGMVSPEDDSVVPTTPVLEAEVDTSDSESQWQVSRDTDFSNILFDVKIRDKSHLKIPDLVLSGGTVYYWRVKKKSSKSTYSEWSEPRSFVTEAPEWNDNNGNGVRDDQEAATGVDLNNDGVADQDQPDTIACVRSLVDSSSIGLMKMNGVVDIELLESIDQESIEDTTNRPDSMPSGLLGFRLVVENPGDTVQVGVCLSEAAPENAGWFKYDSVNGWQNYTSQVAFSEDRKTVTFSLTDGGEGDADGTANGIIVDPSGIGFETASSVLTIGASGTEQGCFIGSSLPSSQTTGFWAAFLAVVGVLAAIKPKTNDPNK